MTTDENIVQPVPSRHRSASTLARSVRKLQRSVRDLQAERDTWRERWRQLMRDHEAVVTERDELKAECLRVDEANSRLGEQVRQRDEVIERVRGALAGHPECDRYPNDGGEPILCGWKRAVVDVRAALEGDGR